MNPKNLKHAPGRALRRGLLTWAAWGAAAFGAAPVDGYRVVHTYPHDRTAFTQGLIYLDGALYEGTGLNGHSTLRRVRLETGEVERSTPLNEQYFGEGITSFGDRLYQLTWQSGVGFIYDRANFKPQKMWNYTGEGWGLTQDGSRLIMSDGTEYLRFFDPNTLQQTGRIRVMDAGQPVDKLNELEFVKGEIYANIWQTDRIVRISPKTGAVLGYVDLAGLLGDMDRAFNVDVLNGIAYDAAKDRLFVTGKLWPKLFEIKIVKRGKVPKK